MGALPRLGQGRWGVAKAVGGVGKALEAWLSSWGRGKCLEGMAKVMGLGQGRGGKAKAVRAWTRPW